MTERVVVTGLGLVTPLGCGRDAFMRRLLGGACGVQPITRFDTTRFASRSAALVADFDPREFIRPATLRRMDRLSQMATAAARMALDDAGLKIDAHNRDRVGVVLGTCFGATDVAAQFAKVIFTDSPRRANPILVPNTVMNAPAGHAAIELGVRGVNTTVNHREASAETALAYAVADIAAGRADAILAGGADIVSEFQFEVLSRFRALSPRDGGDEALRPFDARRNGFVVGEGAGVLCLESLAGAESRGAAPYCEIAGWGLSAAPCALNDWPSDPAGPALAITRALQSAGIEPGRVDLVSAAANGSRHADPLEAAALERVFPGPSLRPRVCALKGALGEAFSSGGVRAAAMALSIRQGALPPTVGLREPIAPLSFVLQPEAGVPVRWGLVNAVSSGGTFASLVLKSVRATP
jgi:3-oxoacyl-[acyl-carrier-protein] synthase II